MSRPMVLVFLLMILIITSQFEWKQQLVSEIEASTSISEKQQRVSNREEFVKEKDYSNFHTAQLLCIKEIIDSSYDMCLQCGTPPWDKLSIRKKWNVHAEPIIILSQEKSIQRLNELVRNLRKQLQQCRGDTESINSTAHSLTENVNELERQQILED